MSHPSTPPVSGASRGEAPPFEPEQLIAVWKTAVETQMHFNEMSVKSRQLGLTFVVAALGLGIVLLGGGDDFSIAVGDDADPLFRLHVTVMLVLGALLGIFGVRQLDLNVYHRMLRGAVAFGEDLEQRHLAPLLTLSKGMTQVVSHYSRNGDADSHVVRGRNEYLGKDEKSAEKKIKSFYLGIQLALTFIAALLFLVTSGLI